MMLMAPVPGGVARAAMVDGSMAATASDNGGDQPNFFWV
jgi:hypothetical protein